jgi:hypothetical protein
MNIITYEKLIVISLILLLINKLTNA